jgi:hypothetical protein
VALFSLLDVGLIFAAYECFLHERQNLSRFGSHHGCQMVLFSNQKSQFQYILEGLAMGNLGVFYGHLVYFISNCYIL